MKRLPPVPLLGKAVIGFVVIILALAFLFAPQPKPVDVSSVDFHMTSSSRLYFRNVRSYYYDVEVHKASGFVLYRLKRRERDTSHTCILFSIIENTGQDEAYIYLELQDPGKQYPEPYVLISKVTGVSEVQPLHDLDNEEHFRTAAAIWKGLLQDDAFILVSGTDTLADVLNDRKTRKDAEIVLEDYFKLIGKF
ncbi:MAG: hypothetical protein ACPF9D_03960 [Owenweeksia sp.]